MQASKLKKDKKLKKNLEKESTFKFSNAAALLKLCKDIIWWLFSIGKKYIYVSNSILGKIKSRASHKAPLLYLLDGLTFFL